MGVATGLGMVFGLDQDIITTVAGAVVSLASVITYVVTEGKIDADGGESGAGGGAKGKRRGGGR